jgi:hypothetical protein
MYRKEQASEYPLFHTTLRGRKWFLSSERTATLRMKTKRKIDMSEKSSVTRTNQKAAGDCPRW